MPEVLMVVAPTMFRDEEYAEPKAHFESLGAQVTTASVSAGPCTGRFGLHTVADIGVVDAEACRYEAVVFVGGGGSQVFFDDPEAHRLAREAYDLGKVVAAICIAPTILAHAGLLKGRRVTAFRDQQTELVADGAIYVAAPVVVDHPFVTGNGPEAAQRFAEAVAAAACL